MAPQGPDVNEKQIVNLQRYKVQKNVDLIEQFKVTDGRRFIIFPRIKSGSLQRNSEENVLFSCSLAQGTVTATILLSTS